MAGCEYYIGKKKFTEAELKQYLIDGALESFIEEGAKAIDLSKIDIQKPKVFGTKNVISKATRTELSLNPVALPKIGKDQEVLAEGKQLVDDGIINPLEIVNRINSTDNHGVNEDEAKAMTYYSYQLGAAEGELRTQLAQEGLTPEEKEEIIGKLGQINDRQDAFTEANIKSGRDWSRVGDIRQITVDEGFNASREKAFIKDSYGGTIPDEVKAELDKTIKERDEALAERTRLEEQLRQKEALLKIQEIKKQGKDKNADHKAKRASLFEELKQAKAEHEQYLKDKGIQKAGISGFVLTPKMVKIIGEIAADYVKEGYEKLEDVVNKVYEEAKTIIPNVDKKDIRDAFAIHEVEKLGKKAEKLEAQIKSGELLKVKTKLKQKLESNNEWVKANQRVLNAESKIKKMKVQALNSEKNMLQIGAMWLGKVFRAAILSGYNVLGKLASAATVGGAVKRIPEQAIGSVWQNAFKGIAQKAPIEGYYYGKAEAKFYKEFFNPKKFWKNTLSILKTGETELTQKMGKLPSEDLAELTMPGQQKTKIAKIIKGILKGADYTLSLPMNSHMIIKDPLKRATFEASFENGLLWAEKNGLDINDELVINSIENAAYKRANYEIFLEDNKFSSWINKNKSAWQREEGNKGAVKKLLFDFIVPVSTVPTNIVRRIISTSPLGLARGLAKASFIPETSKGLHEGGLKKATEAYKESVDKLSGEEADSIMRQLKQGTLGTALWLLGWYGYQSFGGLYSKYDPNKKRQMGELSSDEMMVNGKMIPKPVQHALPLEIIQFSATARHIYENYRQNKGADKFESVENAALGSIGALAEKIPTLATGALFFEATQDPYKWEKLKEDLQRRFKPQILAETGVINGDKMGAFVDKNSSDRHIYKNEIKAFDKRGKPREIPMDEFVKYKEKVKDEQIGRLQYFYLHGAPVMGDTKVIPFDQLTPEQKDEEVKKIKSQITKEIKDKMFGEEIESGKQAMAKDRYELARERQEREYKKSLK